MNNNEKKIIPSSMFGRPSPHKTPEEIYQFGSIMVFIGGNGGKYPHCNTLYVDDERKTIIDPGSSYRRLKKLAEQGRVDTVFFSHYHEDHTRCARLFKDSEMLIHSADLSGVQSISGLMDNYGVKDTFSEKIWLNVLINGLSLVDLPQVKPLPDHEIDFGKTKAQVIHTPGHTPGHVCLYFAEQGILHSADFDLDPWGPYYGDAVSSLADLLASLDIIKQINPKIMITGHHQRIVKKDIPKRLDAFRDIIFEREQKILDALARPTSVLGLHRMNLIFGKFYEPRTLFELIGTNMIRQHLVRLTAAGKIEQIGEDLFVQR